MRQMREDYERQLADATDELSQANACLETLRATEATLTQSIQEKASLVEQLTEQLQTAEKQAYEKGLLSEKINSENQLLQEKSNLMQEQIQVLEERIQQAEQRLGTQSNTSQQLQQAVDLLNQANDKITQQQSTIRNLSGQIEQQNQTILDQQAQIEENEQAAKLEKTLIKSCWKFGRKRTGFARKPISKRKKSCFLHEQRPAFFQNPT